MTHMFILTFTTHYVHTRCPHTMFSYKCQVGSSAFDFPINHQKISINHQSTELFNFNFRSLEVVSHYSATQLQVTKNVCYL